MSKQPLRVNFDLVLDKVERKNSTFDLAKVRIAYSGKNRNRTQIEKNVFEAAIPSLFNVPLVGHYLPEENDFGGHDVRFVKEEDGKYRLINDTVPFGIVPESAEWWWEEEGEGDAAKAYLCTHVLLWKRQYGYDTLLARGSWAQSMEIGVEQYHVDEEGWYVIDRMEFEALCILGSKHEPCFEDASVQFSCQPDASQQGFSEMLAEFKQYCYQAFAQASHDKQEPEAPTQEEREKEGENGLDKDNENKPMPENEAEQTPVAEEAETPVVENEAPEQVPETFALTATQMLEEVDVAVRELELIIRDDYTYPRYRLVDLQDQEAIVCDVTDYWRYYGIPYVLEQNKPVLDVTGKKRKKVRYEDFSEEGELPPNPLFALAADMQAKAQAALTAYQANHQTEDNEVEALRQFQRDVKDAQHKGEIDAVLAEFADLAEVAEFQTLQEGCYEFASAAEVEEKCYAILGRQGGRKTAEKKGKQSLVRLPFSGGEDRVDSNEPYDGLFVRLLHKKGRK